MDITPGKEEYLREWIDMSMTGKLHILPLQLHGLNEFLENCKTQLKQ